MLVPCRLCKGYCTSFALFFFSLGGLGLLLLGVLDSSFLFMPPGNDLLLVALTANHPHRMPWYVLMATLGSVIGVAIAWLVSAKSGQKTLESRRKGFPFTPFIIVAAALQYPRGKMPRIVGACRLLRFVIDSSLAIVYGHQIIGLAQSPKVQGFIAGLVVVSLAGSAWSIFSWIRKSRSNG